MAGRTEFLRLVGGEMTDLFDPTDLIEMRSENAPLAVWRQMVVSSVHHDYYEPVSLEQHEMAERIVMDLLDRTEGIASSFAAPEVSLRAAWETQPRRVC